MAVRPMGISDITLIGCEMHNSDRIIPEHQDQKFDDKEMTAERH